MDTSNQIMIKKGAVLLPRAIVTCHRGNDSYTILCTDSQSVEEACQHYHMLGFQHIRVYDISLSAPRPYLPAPHPWEGRNRARG